MSNFRRPRREDEAYLKFVRQLPCAACGNNIETQAAHVRYGCLEIGKRQAGMAEKSDDMFAVPLCGNCHEAQHAYGDERGWWEKLGRDPIKLSLAIYAAKGDFAEAERVVLATI